MRLRPKASNPHLTITTGLDGKGKSPVSSGQAGPAVALAVGDNALVVKTEFNGQHQTYRVTVTRQAAAGVAVSLSATPNPVGEGSPVTVRATLTAALLGGCDDTAEHEAGHVGGGGPRSSGIHHGACWLHLGHGQRSRRSRTVMGRDETFTLAVGSLPAGLTAGSASSVQVTITKQQSSGTTTDTSTTTSSSDTTTSSSGVSTAASGPDGETLLVGFGQIAQTPPEVSITALDGASPISEGEEARFRVTATPAPAAGEGISVAVTVTDSGDFARSVKIDGRTIATIDEGRATFMVPMNSSGTADFSVATQNDDMDEPDGAITATVTPGTGYTVSDNTAEVEVRDNDAPRCCSPHRERREGMARPFWAGASPKQVVDALAAALQHQQHPVRTTTHPGRGDPHQRHTFAGKPCVVVQAAGV